MVNCLPTFTAAQENSCANSFARDRAIILQEGRNICPSISRCAAELHSLSTSMVIFALWLVAALPEPVLKREGELKQRKGRDVHQKKILFAILSCVGNIGDCMHVFCFLSLFPSYLPKPCSLAHAKKIYCAYVFFVTFL